MNKIVINTENVGINFTTDLYLDFCKRSNLPLFIYYTAQEQYRNQPNVYKKTTDVMMYNLPELTGKIPKYPSSYRLWFLDSDLGDEFTDESLLQYKPHINNLSRNNSVLIEMVEEGLFNGLKIVEIPENIEWYIDEIPFYYDTCREIIREKHKIWE